MNNGLIRNYLNNINTVSESRFNICRRCFKYQNKYFCKICDRNLCQDCSINCRKKNHELIDLIQAKLGDILTARKDVTRLIDKRFKEEEITKSKINAEKIDNINKTIINKNQEKIKENIANYSRRNDFLLIARIVLKDYTNYYYYENILSCYRYLANRFLHTLDKNCLKIIYAVEKDNKEVQIFHPNFVAKNKDKFNIIVNNEPTNFDYKVTVDEDYLEVILIQKSKDDYITDLSYMFCGCTNLIGIKEHLDHKLIDFGRVIDISHMFENCVKIEKIDFDIFKNLSWINKVKVDNLFYNCPKLKEIKGLQQICGEFLRTNNNGYEKFKIKINNNISFNSSNNEDINISINNNNSSLSNGNNSNEGLSHSKKMKLIEYENKIKELKQRNDSLEVYKKKEKDEENFKNLLKNKDFEKAFEIAINLRNIELIIKVINEYYFNYDEEGIEFSKNILADIMSVLCENMSSCEKLGLVIQFILDNICEKNIHFDMELNKIIHVSFFKCRKKKSI